MTTFMEELLSESKLAEERISIDYADLLLIDIRELNKEIENNWKIAEREVEIIKNFFLSKNCKIQERVEYIERKLNAFMLEQDKRTLSLPNGTMRLRKGREKVIVENLNEFLQGKYSHELINIKQELKPDMKKIKDYITRSRKVPEGCKVIPANENEFSYKLNGDENG